ncbi:MAG: DUF1294 domain-containing protein [Myxococcota bacterium]|nr:DUF1294 domain-containing protein [Myxococcota bacterium]
MSVFAALMTFYAIICTLTLCLFGLDKGAAMLGKRRIRESTLHRLEYLGGWPGALIAMRLFNHKRRKASYRQTQRRAIVTHSAVVIGLGAVCWAAV